MSYWKFALLCSVICVANAAHAKDPKISPEIAELANYFIGAVENSVAFDKERFTRLPNGMEVELLDVLRPCKHEDWRRGRNGTIVIPWNCEDAEGKYHKMTILHFENAKISQVSVHDFDPRPNFNPRPPKEDTG